MFEKGVTVSINSPGSDLTGALARIICNVPGTDEYFVEIINEDLLLYKADKHDKRARFHESELTLWEDLDIGSVVTVIDAPAEYRLFGGCQGQIIGYDPEANEFLVIFRPEHVASLPHCATDEDRQAYFSRSQMRKDDNWTPENELEIVFPNRWTVLYRLPDKFIAGKECMREGCSKPTVKRCMFNIWGTVQQRDLCSEHSQFYHGACIDGPFPDKRPQREVKV